MAVFALLLKELITRYEVGKVTKQEWRNLIFLMVLSYLFFAIGVVNGKPMHTTTDELGALVGAAHFAGLDWSGVIGNSGYYGFGYYALFFWLFKVTDSPFVIYRFIVLFTIIIKILVIPIAYFIMKKYLDIASDKYRYMIAFLMPFLQTSSIGIISNEAILELNIWLIILLMCEAVEHLEKKENVILVVVLLLLVCMYSLFIHTRALTQIIALAVVFCIWAVVKKNKSVLLIIVGLPVVYFLSKVVITLFQRIIWGASGGGLRNGAVTISSDFSILDADTWSVWFHILVGMMGTEAILTGGLFVLSIVVCCAYIVHLFKTKRTILSVQGNMILSICGMCIGATLAAFLVSGWFSGMLGSWNDPTAFNSYAFKGMVYVRYWNIYVPPLVMVCMALLFKLQYRNIMNMSLGVIGVINLLFISFVLPIIGNNGSCAGFFLGMGYYEDGMKITPAFYLRSILVSFIIVAAMVWLGRSKKPLYCVLPVIILAVFSHCYTQVEYNLSIKEQISSKILASYEEKCRLEKEGKKIGTIYLNDESLGTDGNWKIYSVAQFYFNHYPLQMELPRILEEDDIIISTCKSDNLSILYPEANIYVLDDNEVWYTRMDLIGYEPIL